MHLLTLWCQGLVRSGLPITEPWKFYYVTSLDLLITTRDNFVTAAGGTKPTETLKDKVLDCGFLGCREGFPSIHLPFLTLEMKTARYCILIAHKAGSGVFAQTTGPEIS